MWPLLLSQMSNANNPDHPVLMIIYILILIVLIIAGFWLVSLLIKIQRFPLPISFPMALSLYMQRVPLDLIADAIRIMQKHNRHIDLYQIIRIYLNHWDDIETPEDLIKLVDPELDITELSWKNKPSSDQNPNN